jgi:hypothetical protein
VATMCDGDVLRNGINGVIEKASLKRLKSEDFKKLKVFFCEKITKFYVFLKTILIFV